MKRILSLMLNIKSNLCIVKYNIKFNEKEVMVKKVMVKNKVNDKSKDKSNEMDDIMTVERSIGGRRSLEMKDNIKRLRCGDFGNEW